MDIIVMTGGPGSGKGTQSKKLAETCGYHHISTGDLLRDRMQVDDEPGREIKALMDRNEFVPDRLIWPLVQQKLAAIPESATVVLDGYPRTLDQMQTLDRTVAAEGYRLKAVIALEISDPVAIRRMLDRGRNEIDRSQTSILKRLRDFQEETVPVIDGYETRGFLKRINGEGTIEACFDKILRALGATPPDFSRQGPAPQP